MWLTTSEGIARVTPLDTPTALGTDVPCGSVPPEIPDRTLQVTRTSVGGAGYEPQLKRLARNALRTRYTDGDIDEMLAAEELTYHDIAGSALL